MARILIASAGKLGLPLAHQLAAAGHQVCAVRRRSPPPARQNLVGYSLDLRRRPELAALDPGIDLAILILTPAARSPEGYRQIYQHALGNLLDHLAGMSPRPACLFVSATSVYGQHHGEWVDEDSPTEPETYNGQSLLEAETAIRQWSPTPLIVRFAGIYGPQRNRLLRQLEHPQTIQRTPPIYTNRIHQEDCIGVLRFLVDRLLQGNLRHTVYIGSDHCPAPKFEVLQWLAWAAGQPGPRPLDSADPAPQNKRCRNHRLLETGYCFRYPDYQSGYNALLETSSRPTHPVTK